MRSSAAVVMAILLAGCAGDDRPPAERVAGTYRAPSGPNTLELRGDSWTLTSGTLVKTGIVEVTPARMAFVLERVSSPAFDLYCRETVDVYDWELEGEALRFRAVGHTCDRAARAVFMLGPWRRVGS